LNQSNDERFDLTLEINDHLLKQENIIDDGSKFDFKCFSFISSIREYICFIHLRDDP